MEPSQVFWFSLQGNMQEIPDDMKIEGKYAQRLVACLETLAQIGLLRLRLAIQNLQGKCVVLHQHTDSSSSLGAINKLFSTKVPLSKYLWMLADWSISHRADVRLSHLGGKANDWADTLSRYTDPCSVFPFDIAREHRCSTQELFDRAPGAKLFPAQAHWPEGLETIASRAV